MEQRTLHPISLDEYDDAIASVARRDNTWQFFPALGGFLLAVLGSTWIGQHFFPDDDPGKWWKVMIGPVIAALVTAPWLFWAVRSPGRIADGNVLLSCPSCKCRPSQHAVRMTGCCDECGTPMVCLPEGSGESLPDRSRFAACVENDRRLLTRIVLIPAYFTTFALSMSMFLRNETLCNVWGVACIFFFVGGMIIHSVIVSRSEGFSCRNCDINLRKEGNAWTLATGRCGDCAHLALECHEPSALAKLLNGHTLRSRKRTFHKRIVCGIATGSLICITMMVLIRLFGENLFGDYSYWVILAIHPAIALTVLYAKVVLKRDPLRSCPLCQKSISDTYDVVAATGRCPQCYGRICE